MDGVRIPRGVETELVFVTAPTRLEAHAFQLLNVSPVQSVPVTMTGCNLFPKPDRQQDSTCWN